MAEKSPETEFVVYGKIENPSALTQASAIEKHRQWEGTTRTGKRMRVRETTIGEEKSVVFTTKHPQAEGGKVAKNQENSESVSEGFIDVFSDLAERLIVKTRYVFQATKITVEIGEKEPVVVEIPDVKFEIDQFINQDTGQPSEFVKVDIELDSIIKFFTEHYPGVTDIHAKFMLSKLPVNMSRCVFANSDSEADQEWIKKMWETEWARNLLTPTKQQKEPSGTQTPGNQNETPSEGEGDQGESGGGNEENQ